MKPTSPILFQFGLVIKDLRKRRRFSQEELANRCGLHRTYITDIEHGSRNVSLKNISKIARAFDMTPSDLFAAMDEYSKEGIQLISRRDRTEKVLKNPVEILLVEDDQNYVELTIHELQRVNISNHIHVARTGEDAIIFLFGTRTEPHPIPESLRLILLDLSLPLIDGHNVLKRIRTHSSRKDIPVVVMTSSTSPADQERCNELGVQGYLTKPLNAPEFITAMQKLGFMLYLMEGQIPAQ